MRTSLAWIVPVSLLLGCPRAPEPIGKSAVPSPKVTATAEAESKPPSCDDPRVAARWVVERLAKHDLSSLSAMVGPRGLRFSPSAHVDPASDVVLSPAEVAGAWDDPTARTWGTREGEGGAIREPFRAYFGELVYDVDFARAPQVAVDEALGGGTVPANHAEIYPGAHVVEFHFPGFDPKYDGMDWRTLRVVIGRDDGACVVLGIIHAQWSP